MEASSPDAHPGHARGDDGRAVVGVQVPQAPLVHARRGHGEDPRQAAGQQAQKLPMACVRQEQHVENDEDDDDDDEDEVKGQGCSCVVSLRRILSRDSCVYEYKQSIINK